MIDKFELYTIWSSFSSLLFIETNSDGDYNHEIKRSHSLEEKLYKPREHIKKQRHYFVNKGPSTQGYDFSSDHVWM